MNSRTTDRFWRCYKKLPEQIKVNAKDAYEQFREDPYYSSLHFKRVHSTRPIFSIRITKNYRAVGIQQDNEIIWFWIGSHADYDKLLQQLRNA
jgi:hypothetical protein